MGSPISGESHARPGDSQDSTIFVESRRFSLQWPIAGAAEWLDYWPDGADQSLVPVDRLLGEPDLENPEWKRDWNRRMGLGKRFAREGSIVHSFVEVAADDPRAAREAREQEVSLETELLERFMEAVRTSAELHRRDLLALIRPAVTARRRRLAWEHHLVEGLELRPAPSTLQLVETGVEPTDRDEAFSLPSRRLDDPSVLALHRTIRHWSDKVEQYPTSFLALTEDDVSNLLAVTLALAFGVAEREVFCRGGKSDVYIPVAALRELAARPRESSDEVAFVAEAKKGSGPALANRAKQQLDDYVPIRARHAALLFYVEAGRLDEAVDRILVSLRARNDYEGEDELDGSPYQILRFKQPTTGMLTSVAIIFIHLNPRNPQSAAG
ncbi:MAG: hypothetical protein QOI95_2916 [Acidimicrobiaceae bacterium]